MAKHSIEWHNAALTVKTGQGALIALICKAGSADATLTVYDGTSTGGTQIAKLSALAGDSAAAYFGEGGVAFTTGLHCVPAGGGGASMTAVYD